MPLMSEVTVNNKLKFGICFKKAAHNIFRKAGLTRQSFIDILYNCQHCHHPLFYEILLKK
jgi:hypothetical protein